MESAEQEIIEEKKQVPFSGWKKWFDMKFFLFLFFIAMIHITNNHWAMTQMRNVNKLGKELREKRWDYLTTKSDLMNRSKQSEVAKQVEMLQLKELVNPPNKVAIHQDEFKVDDND